MGPLFLEIQVEPGRWRTAQHPRWGSLEIDTMFTYAPDHDESETELVSAFIELGPAHGVPRVILQLADNAMLLAMSRKERMIDGYLTHEAAEEYTGLVAA